MAIRSDAVRAAAARLIEPLGAADEIIVAPFTKTIGPVTGPTTDRATVLDAIGAIRHKGGTAILDALSQAASTLTASTRRKAVVLITDGYDENSDSKVDQATDALETQRHHALCRRPWRYRGHFSERREAPQVTGRGHRRPRVVSP